MSAPYPTYLHALAEECADLVFRQFGRRLDWSPESLSTLDEVCVDLLADGPLAEGQLDLWWRLIGASPNVRSATDAAHEQERRERSTRVPFAPCRRAGVRTVGSADRGHDLVADVERVGFTTWDQSRFHRGPSILRWQALG
ncbi:hypothetical protein ACGFJ5_24590 [Micromonospora echinaurantiaca]|uniref:hypothetical protein n=1 Tax=Micromonospora echinaurantiaca TaxID=47857 RepID=UPI0037235E4B